MEDRKRGELSHERIKARFIHRIGSREVMRRKTHPHRVVLQETPLPE
jgi:hypothetical protein